MKDRHRTLDHEHVRPGRGRQDRRSQRGCQELGISDEALAQVEEFKAALTAHNAWDLPFMGYVNEDGYGYAYVPDAAITMNPYWDAHKEFMNLPEDVQTAFAIRMLFTHRPVDRYGADMFLHYHRGFQVNFVGSGANKY